MKYIAPDKIFYHPERLSQWMNEEIVKPITAEIHLSNRCNNACYYCGQKHNQNGKDMSLEDIKLLKNFLTHIGVKSLYFSGGGESTLNKDIFTALDELKSFEKGMITNAVFMPDKLIERYVHEFRWVRISIDAGDNQTYYNIRGIKDFEKVCANIDKLLIERDYHKTGLVVGLQIVVNEYNYNDLKYICGSLLSYFPRIDYINIRPIEDKIDKEIYSKEQLESIKSGLDFLQNNNKIIISDKWHNIFEGKKDFGFKICNAGDFIFTITADGDIYQCCHVIHLDNYKIANLNNSDGYFFEREVTFELLPNRGFNPKICPLGCRGSGINKSIESMIKEKHRNFL